LGPLHPSAQGVGDGEVEPLGDNPCRVALGAWSWIALAASFAGFDADVSGVEPAELAQAFGRLGERLQATSAP